MGQAGALFVPVHAVLYDVADTEGLIMYTKVAGYYRTISKPSRRGHLCRQILSCKVMLRTKHGGAGSQPCTVLTRYSLVLDGQANPTSDCKNSTTTRGLTRLRARLVARAMDIVWFPAINLCPLNDFRDALIFHPMGYPVSTS